MLAVLAVHAIQGRVELRAGAPQSREDALLFVAHVQWQRFGEVTHDGGRREGDLGLVQIVRFGQRASEGGETTDSFVTREQQLHDVFRCRPGPEADLHLFRVPRWGRMPRGAGLMRFAAGNPPSCRVQRFTSNMDA